MSSGADVAALAAHRREIEFQLFELLGSERLAGFPRFAEHSKATFAAALQTAETIAAERFAPLHRVMDEDEPRLVDGRVAQPQAVQGALRAFADAGFVAATHDEADGGMQLPFSVAMGCYALFKAANIALEAYATLSCGVATLLKTHATAEQQARYLPPLLQGRWFGTMVLTEPQAGSSLADLRSRATPQADGRYRLRGRKLFITAGDHELAENIVHLVLARIEGAPAGVRGLSLFIAPKVRVDATGALGGRNDVALAGLIHKLGFRGTTSAMLNFGEQGECEAELLGRPHEGLACMFGMMNEARIAVGLGSAMVALAGYRDSLAYARERRQGRIDRDPASPPVAIVEHADVRRMLLQQKAWAEGALSLSLYAAQLQDLHQHGDAAEQRREAGLLLELLTPVVKAWCSHYGCAANDLAIQVLGGYGYTRDFAVEQHWRDNRLNALHEGTNGIQALDLLGRKLGTADGAAFELLHRVVADTVAAARVQASMDVDDELLGQAEALATAWGALRETTQTLLQALKREPRAALAGASTYLDLFGHSVVGWLWLKQALRARQALVQISGAAADFYRGKLAAARHFFVWDLAAAQACHAPLRCIEAGVLALDPAWL